jgi:hypothetical protein
MCISQKILGHSEMVHVVCREETASAVESSFAMDTQTLLDVLDGLRAENERLLTRSERLFGEGGYLRVGSEHLHDDSTMR